MRTTTNTITVIASTIINNVNELKFNNTICQAFF